MPVLMTNSQKRQIVELFKESLNAVGPSQKGAEIIIRQADELKMAVGATLTRLSQSQFIDEEVASIHTYPGEYGVKGINQQMSILRSLFPDIGLPDDGILKQPLPEGAEGWFVIPRWQKLASTYSEAVELALRKIAEQRQLHNYHDGQLGPERLREHDHTIKMLQILASRQRSDTLFVPCQFGFRHRGRSSRRAREVFLPNEFGLGAFSVAIMLLTHPERLSRNNLWVDCVGAEFSEIEEDHFDLSPYFHLSNGGIAFDVAPLDAAHQDCGPASAFLPYY